MKCGVTTTLGEPCKNPYFAMGMCALHLGKWESKERERDERAVARFIAIHHSDAYKLLVWSMRILRELKI